MHTSEGELEESSPQRSAGEKVVVLSTGFRDHLINGCKLLQSSLTATSSWKHLEQISWKCASQCTSFSTKCYGQIQALINNSGKLLSIADPQDGWLWDITYALKPPQSTSYNSEGKKPVTLTLGFNDKRAIGLHLCKGGPSSNVPGTSI